MTDEIDRLEALLREATPGPWRACCENLYVYGGDGHQVADRLDDGEGSVLRGRGHGAEVSGRRREGEGEANVRAIAALGRLWPELLAVARTAECRIPQYCPGPNGGMCSVCEATDALRARIREVLGEADRG